MLGRRGYHYPSASIFAGNGAAVGSMSDLVNELVPIYVAKLHRF